MILFLVCFFYGVGVWWDFRGTFVGLSWDFQSWFSKSYNFIWDYRGTFVGLWWEKVEGFGVKTIATDYAKKMNKTARVYKYVVLEYKKSDGGNGKKLIVKKVKK